MAAPTHGLSLPDDIGADNFAAVRAAWRRLTGALSGILARDKTGTVTLTASTTTTTLTDPRIGPTSQVVFTPTTANAATAAAALYVGEGANLKEGVRTLTHASNAAVDQIFRYTILGS